MNKAVVCVMVLALLCTATYAQNPLTAITDAAKKVTDTVDSAVNGTKTAVTSVTNGTKGAIDGVRGAAGALGNITGAARSAAGYHAPTFGLFAAAGFGSLLLLAL